MDQNIYIVGAHSRAQTLGTYLTKLYPDMKIVAYLYDNEEPNDKEINGIPVLHFNEKTRLQADWPVYLGTQGGISWQTDGKVVPYGDEKDHPGYAGT